MKDIKTRQAFVCLRCGQEHNQDWDEQPCVYCGAYNSVRQVTVEINVPTPGTPELVES